MSREMITSRAAREAIINAVVHNDYSYGGTPKIEFFSDRVEITSMGGLPYGVSESDFFSGFSIPRNKEIMRVFRDLEIVEQLGSGIPRILEVYSKNVFEIRESFVRIVLPYAKPLVSLRDISEQSPGLTITPQVGTKSALSRHQVEILHKCRDDSALVDLMAVTGRSDRTKFRDQVLRPLLEAGLIEMTIPDKPRSSKQRYRLTDKGRQWLKEGGKTP